MASAIIGGMIKKGVAEQSTLWGSDKTEKALAIQGCKPTCQSAAGAEKPQHSIHLHSVSILPQSPPLLIV